MKSKLKKIKEDKTERHRLLSYSEWCSINSYIGWIQYCDHYRLYEKFIKCLLWWLNKYYYFVITNKNKKKTIKYYRNLKDKQY